MHRMGSSTKQGSNSVRLRRSLGLSRGLKDPLISSKLCLQSLEESLTSLYVERSRTMDEARHHRPITFMPSCFEHDIRVHTISHWDLKSGHLNGVQGSIPSPRDS